MDGYGYLHWKDFLDAEMIALARSTAIDHRQRFNNTTVTTDVPNFRRSKVLWHHDYPTLHERFIDRLRSLLPHIREAFPTVPEQPQFELQLTSHHDGDFFKRHIDNGCAQTEKRVLTYVYYFTLGEEPRFTGGDLLLDNTETLWRVTPIHNTIVLFPSGFWHEVLPVQVPSGAWEDGRWTINGWLRSA